MNGNFFDEEIIESFEIFYLLSSVNSEVDNCFQDQISSLEGLRALTYKFYSQNSRTLEIVFQGVLKKIQFVVYPACLHLSRRSKLEFLEGVDRFSTQQKLKDLMKASSKMIDDMEFEQS